MKQTHKTNRIKRSTTTTTTKPTEKKTQIQKHKFANAEMP